MAHKNEIKTLKSNKMEIKFNDSYLAKLYSNQPIKDKPVYSNKVVIKFKKIVTLIAQIENSVKLRSYKALDFEALKSNKKGIYSVRIDKQCGLEFKTENNLITLAEIVLIEDLSKDYE